MAPTEFFSIIIHIVKGEAIFVLAVMFGSGASQRGQTARNKQYYVVVLKIFLYVIANNCSIGLFVKGISDKMVHFNRAFIQGNLCIKLPIVLLYEVVAW
jgi:hypothetical protein